MAAKKLNELRIGAAHYEELREHLLRDDRDEHGAILLAGAHVGPRGTLLTVREVHPPCSRPTPPPRGSSPTPSPKRS